MKRFLAFIMALVLILSFSVTAFAAGGDGSITITNATVGQTYSIYKIFDATMQLDSEGNATAVSYTITRDNQFFAELFGKDGKTENTYFVYEPSTGAVAKRAGVTDTDLIAYLKNLVATSERTPAAAPIMADSSEVKFEELPYGYYMIRSTLGAVVTINSTTPHVEVIDKNQDPAPDFNKQVQTGVDENGAPIWGDFNSAAVGDVINYKISFTATNYDGDKLIKYYQIHDFKGDALWADFTNIRIWVGDEELTRGYYLNLSDEIDESLTYLGEWGTEEKNRNNAQWYLVHLGMDEFRITIPWLEDHAVKDVTVGDKIMSYSLTFGENAKSKFVSPAVVTITYPAAIEANADIGDTGANLINRASASWTSEHETGSSSEDEVKTTVYGLGLLKDDAATGKNLQGAEFRLYKDETCTDPVYVIPTKIDGVYILDSLNSDIKDVYGDGKDTSRELYEAYLEEYLGQYYENKQDNLVVSQVNGKLVVLGLEKGTYYLREVKAPDGYNALSAPVVLNVGEGTKAFSVFANADGEVADIQTTDGTHLENSYHVTSTVVHNSKGVELPSTGGAGTMMLITIGAMVAMAFAVLLITHKKMSVYKD